MAILGAINPMLTVGLDGDNAWRLADYVKRDGYSALRRILGGGCGPGRGHVGRTAGRGTQDEGADGPDDRRHVDPLDVDDDQVVGADGEGHVPVDLPAGHEADHRAGRGAEAVTEPGLPHGLEEQ